MAACTYIVMENNQQIPIQNLLPVFMLMFTGYKYVFQPNPNRDICSLSRYQPFIFHTTGYSQCAYLKSLCNIEGMKTHTDGTSRSDRTCNCDTALGFTFVVKQKQKCYCNPISEDCSCFIDTKSKNRTIGWKG